MSRTAPNKTARAEPTKLSYNVNAAEKAIERIRKQPDEERTDFIISELRRFFGDDIKANPSAFLGRFRKMAATAFNFYRGSALLFYQDLKNDRDPFIEKNPAAGHIFIHGDLHAKNFGTYLNSDGILNFDVNDFDEGYVGPFTWDVKRLIASLNILCYSKGFSDSDIAEILETCAREYLNKVHDFCRQAKDRFALTLKTTTGKIQRLLNETRVQSHVEHLNRMTCIEKYDRKFIRNKVNKDVDTNLHNQLTQAFQEYLKSIPDNKKHSDRGYNGGQMDFTIKDIVQCSSVGIGSAGKISYLFLLEGRSETLENDVILSMKPAQISALSYVVELDDLKKYFKNDGLRIVLCAYAMQASTHRWLGYTSMNSESFLVDSVSAHTKELDWDVIDDMNDVLEVVKYLGQATAKIHCVADADCIDTPGEISRLPFKIIPRSTEKTIRDAIGGRDDEFVKEMVEFGMNYGELVRRDHQLFFDALRNGMMPELQQKN